MMGMELLLDALAVLASLGVGELRRSSVKAQPVISDRDTVMAALDGRLEDRRKRARMRCRAKCLRRCAEADRPRGFRCGEGIFVQKARIR
jgi:hypothetical protein